jgi:hypothetical protein
VSTALVRWNLTEDSIKTALIEARGDIFIASQMLGITALRMTRAIQVSPILQATMEAIPENSEAPLDSIRKAVEQRLVIYRVVGLDALADLATMPINSNSAQNQVKLAAASRLAGSAESGLSGSEVDQTLRLLNDEYQKHAPRIKVTRERMTVEMMPSEPPAIDQQ